MASNAGEFSTTPAANPGEFIEQPVSAGAATPSSNAGGAGPFGFLSTASHSANLLGDMWGLRPMLSKYGVTLSITETSEILGNVSGGTRQGFDYDGLTTATATGGGIAMGFDYQKPVCTPNGGTAKVKSPMGNCP